MKPINLILFAIFFALLFGSQISPVNAQDSNKKKKIERIKVIGKAEEPNVEQEKQPEEELPETPFGDDVDDIFAVVANRETPGCAAGFIQNGEFIYRAGYGLANLEHNILNTPDTVFRIASLSKQFTAAAVHLLAEEGKIDLDADIRTYLTDLPEYPYKVTVRAMLGHVSGLKDYEHIAASFEGDKLASDVNLTNHFGRPLKLGNEDFLTTKEFYSAAKLLSLDHQPETQFEYNNLAYFLLSQLVEKQSGKSLRKYADSQIFEPLGMRKTFYSDDSTELIMKRASGYAPRKGAKYVNHMTNLFWVGDGGVHTSINDFIHWDRNFYQPQLGKNPQKFIQKMNTPNSKLGYEDTYFYANGQFIGEVAGRKAYFHSGGWVGFASYYVRFEKEKFSAVALCNNENINPSYLIEESVKVYFKHFYKPPSESKQSGSKQGEPKQVSTP